MIAPSSRNRVGFVKSIKLDNEDNFHNVIDTTDETTSYRMQDGCNVRSSDELLDLKVQCQLLLMQQSKSIAHKTQSCSQELHRKPCFPPSTVLCVANNRRRKRSFCGGPLRHTTDKPTKEVQEMVDSNPPTKKFRHITTRAVRFDLSATTVHCIDRPCYSSKSKWCLHLIREYEKHMSLMTDDDSVESFESIDSYSGSTDEKDSLWYSQKELRAIKATVVRGCRRLNIDEELSLAYAACSEDDGGSINDRISHVLSDSDLFPAQRGLERWSSKDHWCERGTQKVLCKLTFFLEQSKQICSLQHDPNQLANVYEQGSRAAVKFAKLLAQADHQIALLQ